MERCYPAPPAEVSPGALPTRESLLQNQSQCWLGGEPLRVEAYLQLHPGLNTDRELVLDLIFHELLLRMEGGESPDPDEYLQRFPEYAEDLRTQFEVRQAFAEGDQDLATIIGTVPGLGGNRVPALRVAGYEVLKELGRGGGGVVYLARHRGLDRLVALKMIQSPAQACPRQLARFRGEAEVLAKLQHPNIVQIFEVGEHEGRPFLALEYLSGGGLDRRLRGSPQPPRQAAQLLWSLVRAVGAAHEAGVIHRDLKPANILLAADDTPKIADFGLAKRLDAASGQTATGDILGTPHYMAPEQAYGHRGTVGPWTDVYALGAIFYELLTGRPPFNGATVWDTLEQMVSNDPVPPRRLQATVPRDLEVICLKCLAKETGKRYPHAAELAEDLRRFLAGEPIRARPAPAVERAWKWARRRPALAAAAGTGLLIVVVLLWGAMVWLRAAASTARFEAHEAQGRAAAALALADLKDDLRQVEAASDSKRWKEARPRLEGILRQLDVAEQAYSTDMQFHELRLRAEDLQRTIELQLTARERLERFRSLRTEAGFLVMGLAGTDSETRENRARAVVGLAFALFGAGPEAAPLPTLDQSTLAPEEQREVKEGCCEMLLGLVQFAAELRFSDNSAEQRRGAERALVLLNRAVQLRASPGICHARRARCLDRLGRRAEARQEEERSRVYSPDRAFEFFLRGSDLYADGDLDGAVAAFEKALSLEPNHAAAAYALALPHLRLRTREAQPAVARAHLLVARMSLTACIERQPALPWPYLCRAYTQGELGEYQAADSDFAAAERALRASPDAAARYALLVSRGALRIRRGELKEATDDLTEAVQSKPQDYQAHVNLARAYQLQHLDDAAVREMDQAVALGTPATLAALYRTRARLHQEAGRTEAAIHDLDESARHERGGEASPQAAEDLLVKGRLLAHGRDYAGAVEAFDAALTARPDHPAALRARAEALLRLRRNDEALRDLNRLLEGERGRQAGVAPLFRARAGARMEAGDYPGAVEDYTHALGLEPDQAAYSGRGWGYLALEVPTLARVDFDRAVRLNPKDGDAHNGLAYARVKLGKYREAVENAEEALRLDPATARNRYNSARVFAAASVQASQDSNLPIGRGRELGRQYQDRTVALLRDTLAALPVGERTAFWLGTIRRDAALNSIRPSDGFRQLATEYTAAVPDR